MSLALDLAREYKGLTHPNPTVGCVIVKDGVVVGKGAHEKAGLPHAEVIALKEAGHRARGATLYVTLEPCSHWGRTPPCVDAIIQAGIKRVVIATLDPNPLVCGQGVSKLRQAGIQVDVGVLEEEARELNEDFFLYITEKRPYVTLKLAQSIDGKIATKTGDSKWISGQKSREFAHRLRHEATAVLVGIGTVLKDDPLLTVRHIPAKKQPLRIVLDPDLEIPMGSKLVVEKSAKTLVVTSSDNTEKIKLLEDMGVEVLRFPSEGGRFNLRDLLKEFHRREIMHILVEGGSQTATEFIKAGLVDRLCVFIGPMVIGSGKTLGDIGVEFVKDTPRFTLRRCQVIDQDVYLEYVR
ncbi:diaminohydroxyphosphoribosylaminopyrimidine deaminase [Thermocrinis minervae]|uniref:Riboflavin biosynthesis protein RibD n=2 Tax=Thermocrinis minervae TaxID=381751 RepID=A0A1M6QDE1_9AQUI|nr:diaminohydroxyphosphoribosylaminopyrimidine deaminase [Thermocrinis minervae]